MARRIRVDHHGHGAGDDHTSPIPIPIRAATSSSMGNGLLNGVNGHHLHWPAAFTYAQSPMTHLQSHYMNGSSSNYHGHGHGIVGLNGHGHGHGAHERARVMLPGDVIVLILSMLPAKQQFAACRVSRSLQRLVATHSLLLHHLDFSGVTERKTMNMSDIACLILRAGARLRSIRLFQQTMDYNHGPLQTVINAIITVSRPFQPSLLGVDSAASSSSSSSSSQLSSSLDDEVDAAPLVSSFASFSLGSSSSSPSLSPSRPAVPPPPLLPPPPAWNDIHITIYSGARQFEFQTCDHRPNNTSHHGNDATTYGWQRANSAVVDNRRHPSPPSTTTGRTTHASFCWPSSRWSPWLTTYVRDPSMVCQPCRTAHYLQCNHHYQFELRPQPLPPPQRPVSPVTSTTATAATAATTPTTNVFGARRVPAAATAAVARTPIHMPLRHAIPPPPPTPPPPTPPPLASSPATPLSSSSSSSSSLSSSSWASMYPSTSPRQFM